MKRESKAVSWICLLIWDPMTVLDWFLIIDFLLLIGYISLVLCTPGNFLLDVRHSVFYFAGCWIVLYFWAFSSISSAQECLLGSAWVSLPCARAWKLLRAVTWGDWSAHLTCFLSLRNHYFSLPCRQYLTNHCFLYFFTFKKIVLGVRVHSPCVIIVSKS